MSKLKEKFKSTSKKDKIKFAVFIGFILLTLVIAIILLPNIIALKDQAARDQLKEQILSFGIWSWLIFAVIQVFQIIFAVIPGEPIEVIGGVLYGPWGGLLACEAGALIGTVLVYYLVKCLGYSFINSMIRIKDTNKFKFLHNNKKLNLIVFILFFIPGTPKDVLTYLIPLTEIKPLQYFAITTVARIPSIITSTFAGSAIDNGQWLEMILIFAITGAVAILGIIFNDKIIAFFSKSKHKKDKLPESPDQTTKQ